MNRYSQSEKGTAYNSKIFFRIIICNLIGLFTLLLLSHFYFTQYFIALFELKSKQPNSYEIKLIENIEFVFFSMICILIVVLLSKDRLLKIFYQSSLNSVIFLSISSSIIIQSVLVLMLSTPPISDSFHYIEVANNLFFKSEFSWKGHITSYWPPGLPFVLVLLKFIFGTLLLPAKLLNIFISGISFIVLLKIFKEYLTKNQLKIFSLSWAFFPNNLFAPNILLTEHFFVLFIWLGVLIMLKYNKKKWFKLALVGVLIGLASLFRPSALLLPFVFGSYFFSNGVISYVKNSLIMFLFMIIVVSPWTIRNFNEFNKFIPISSNGGINFLIGNNSKSWGNFNWNFNYNLDNPKEYEEEELAYKNAIEDIINNPGITIARIPLKFFFSYYRGDNFVSWTLNDDTLEEKEFWIVLSRVFSNLIFYNIIVISLLNFIRFKSQLMNSSITHLAVSFMTFFFFLVLVFVGDIRYILPILPIHFYYFSKICS